LLEPAFAAFAFVISLVDCAIRHYSVVLLLVQFSPPNQGEDLRREMEEAIKALTLKQGSLEAEAAESKARMNALEQQLNDATATKRSLEAHAATLAIDLKSASDEREATDKALEAAKTDVRKEARKEAKE
jgi:septal ring factor EnvC (AmiA/AmiB activator)